MVFAFEGCTGLTSITIPNSVTSIEWFAFKNCTELVEFIIGNNVTDIGVYAFSGCTNLNSVEFENTKNWYCKDGYSNSSASLMTVTNTTQNATRFKDTLDRYYWYRV